MSSANGTHGDSDSSPFNLDWHWPDWFSWSDSGDRRSTPNSRAGIRQPPPLWHFHRVIAGRDRDENDSRSGAPHVIQIQSVDWLCRDNGAVHHTDRFELVQERKSCVVRRGFDVRLSLLCRAGGRMFDPNRDRIRLVFEFGKRPNVTKGTRAVAELRIGGPAVLGRPWQALFLKKEGHRVEVSVSVPTAAPVGLWNLTVESWYGDRRAERRIFKAAEPIYVLFNPYHQDDPVHLPHPAGREEYVLNEVGKIYGGSHNSVQGRPWIFGQLRDSVLPATCHLLDEVSNMRDSERGDPVRVARAISAIINSVDDDGVVMGKWDGQYSDGTKPFEWTGSVPILEERMLTGKPVRYGQCWVFAGVVATICRALGIPCRCVTNYVSAHDTNASFSVDKFYDEEGEEISESGGGAPGDRSAAATARPDSIWNFHVWNEVWMERRDLAKEYGGWQVIDATPQEASDNLYQLGPASVEAVRRGEVGLGFDAAFVFTEVNADVFVYVPDRDSNWGYRRIETNTDHVGKLIVTKALGYLSDDTENDYQVLTGEYKAKEGSVDERLALMRAVRNAGGINADYNRYPGQKNQDVYLKMIDLDKGKYGEVYKVSLFLHNQSREDRLVRVVMSSSSVFYTGSKAHLVKKGEGEFVLGPNERETLSMEVDPADYMPKTVEHCQFVNRFLVKVSQTGQIWHGEDDFVLEKPKLDVRVVPETPRANRPCRIFVSLTNPLQAELTGCVFSAEAPGTTRSLRRRFRKIQPGETVKVELEARPWRPGPTTVVATFNSEELYNVTGTKQMTVLG